MLSFPSLLEASLSILSGMQKRGLKKGDRVILSIEQSREIIPVLWGCFLGGIVPALLQPPVSFTDLNPAAEKAEKVFEQLGHPHVILSGEHAHGWKSGKIEQGKLIDATTLSGDFRDAIQYRPDPGDLALIQYSSGSTGEPKGVMLTHANLLANISDIIRGIALGPDDVAVNWMPLYHDMGLIGFHLTPVIVGVNQFFIDPPDFVKNPFLWLDTMSHERCTITACPNFGQAIVNRSLGRRSAHTWDLSSVRILFNGAEPISVTIMQRFLENLAPFGLPPVAMFPAYGLAEATLAVTFPDRLAETEVVAFDRHSLITEGHALPVTGNGENAIHLVNLGKPLPHAELIIVDNDGNELPDGRVGNVWVRGDGITRGYYANPLMTAAAFDGSWLKTGDLGFTIHNDLFITGRTKDIIFINGVNYYAHDLEHIAQHMEDQTTGRLVIAGMFDEKEGRDRLLIFIVGSDNDTTREQCRQIRLHFNKLIGLTPETFIPVRSNDIPRTSSGKIQRYKLVDRYRKGEFSQILSL
jgi:acyl-CoA synthetase (AMP-forming)/AMP-acid ligase II